MLNVFHIDLIVYFKVLRELCVSSDDSVRNLAGDLLYHRNVFDAIDGQLSRGRSM